jgi:hypothetical protein
MEPLSFKSYLFGGLAPFAVLGVAIYFIAFFTGNILMLILSFFNMVAAGGDLTIALMLLPYPHALIVDHPTECGFVAFVKKA